MQWIYLKIENFHFDLSSFHQINVIPIESLRSKGMFDLGCVEGGALKFLAHNTIVAISEWTIGLGWWLGLGFALGF